MSIIAPERLRLCIGDQCLMLDRGSTVRSEDLPGLGQQPGRVLAHVTSHPQHPDVLGLQNESDRAWSVRTAAGKQLTIAPRQVVKLAEGTQIDFGGVTGLLSQEAPAVAVPPLRQTSPPALPRTAPPPADQTSSPPARPTPPALPRTAPPPLKRPGPPPFDAAVRRYAAAPSASRRTGRRWAISGAAIAASLALVAWFAWPSSSSELFPDESVIWSRPLADRSKLPALRNGGELVSTMEFGPAGFKTAKGVRMKFPLDKPQPPGSALWILARDREADIWRSTGEQAVVLASGKEAQGRVFHFSEYALSKLPEYTIDRNSMRTEWIWLMCEHDHHLELLARNVGWKYRERLGVPYMQLNKPEAWDPEKGGISTSKKACYMAGVQEFEQKKKELDEKFLEAFNRWNAVIGQDNLESVVELYEAAGDLKLTQAVHFGSASSKAWYYIKAKFTALSIESIAEKAGSLFERFVGKRFNRIEVPNAAKQKAREKLKEKFDEQVKSGVTGAFSSLFGDFDPEKLTLFADGFTGKADELLLRLAGIDPAGLAAGTRAPALGDLQGQAAADHGFFLSMSLTLVRPRLLEEKANTMRWSVYHKTYMTNASSLAQTNWSDSPYLDYDEISISMSRKHLDEPAEDVEGQSEPHPLYIKEGNTYTPLRTQRIPVKYDSGENTGNIDVLRKNFREYRDALDQEIQRGIDAYAPWMQGVEGAGTVLERARALLAARMLNHDVKHYLEDDPAHQLKRHIMGAEGGKDDNLVQAKIREYAKDITFKGAIEFALGQIKGLAGVAKGVANIFLEACVDVGAQVGEILVPDRLAEVLVELDKSTYRIAGVVVRPNIEPVFKNPKAVKDFLEVPACFASEDCLFEHEVDDPAARKKVLCDSSSEDEPPLDEHPPFPDLTAQMKETLQKHGYSADFHTVEISEVTGWKLGREINISMKANISVAQLPYSVPWSNKMREYYRITYTPPDIKPSDLLDANINGADGVILGAVGPDTKSQAGTNPIEDYYFRRTDLHMVMISVYWGRKPYIGHVSLINGEFKDPAQHEKLVSLVLDMARHFDQYLLKASRDFDLRPGRRTNAGQRGPTTGR